MLSARCRANRLEESKPDTRSQRDGHWLIGMGMAGAIYPVPAFPGLKPQHARARVYSDGGTVVQCGTQEFGSRRHDRGPGRRRWPRVGIDQMRFEVRRYDFPSVSSAVGSAGASMISSAVHARPPIFAIQLVAQAIADPKVATASSEAERYRRIRWANDRHATRLRSVRRTPSCSSAVRSKTSKRSGSWKPTGPDTGFALATFGAQFAEVAVDADLVLVRVRRLVGVVAPGRVLNTRTARSQLMGGMLWGLGQALLEGSYMDPHQGRWANASLGDYLVPVNADAPDVDVELVEVRDEVVNPIGVKGVGEIGQVGAAAAIANAVFHATGRRMQELPIRIEHLL